MLKLELVVLLKEMFALGGNHKPEEANKIRRKLSDFIREEELYLKVEYNEDFEMAKNAIRLIDAINVYAVTSSRMEGYHHMKPFFERLVQIDVWNYYDLKLLASSINFVTTAEEAVELSSKAAQVINNFKDNHNTDVLEGGIACNMCSRLLYAKYFDNNVKVDLAEQFNNWFLRLEQLAETNYKLDLPLLTTKIRQAIFNQDQEQILELCEELKENYDENIENTVKNEISFHTNSKKYNTLLGGEQ